MENSTDILVISAVLAVFLGLAYMIFLYKPKKKKTGGGTTMTSDKVEGQAPKDYRS